MPTTTTPRVTVEYDATATASDLPVRHTAPGPPTRSEPGPRSHLAPRVSVVSGVTHKSHTPAELAPPIRLTVNQLPVWTLG